MRDRDANELLTNVILRSQINDISLEVSARERGSTSRARDAMRCVRKP
tara:strand:+ start:10112 stop:10255 length:144 start_codon:yes stop_codon:yes gene_type:complete